jgi:CheY-like chemotaxis protein
MPSSFSGSMGYSPDTKGRLVFQKLSIQGKYMSTTEPGKASLQVVHLEDDLNDAELIRMELEENHIPCAVTLISSAHEFAVTLRDRKIDLILSDSRVPGFDTLSALKMTREQHRELPFVFISDNSSPKIQAEAFRLGASGFISKRELSKLPRIIQSLFFANAGLPPGKPLPEMGVPVIVQCAEYRCLGFLSADGKWRDFCSSIELPPVSGWSEL